MCTDVQVLIVLTKKQKIFFKFFLEIIFPLMPKITKNKKLHERTVDNINIRLRFLEIREKFPELRDIAIKRIISKGWTTSEILDGENENDIFVPACKYSCGNENQIQYFYIPALTSRRWSKYTARDKKTLLTKIQKNGKYL